MAIKKLKQTCNKCGAILTCPACKRKVRTRVSNTKAVRTAAGNYSRTVKGKRPDVHPTYSFKSRTEANFARILNFLGFNWKYEERAFTFEGYKRKPHVYIPDFVVTGTGKSTTELKIEEGIYEVKGWFNAASREKMRRLRQNYPKDADRTTIVIYSSKTKKDIDFCKKYQFKYLFYDKLCGEFSKIISGWE